MPTPCDIKTCTAAVTTEVRVWKTADQVCSDQSLMCSPHADDVMDEAEASNYEFALEPAT